MTSFKDLLEGGRQQRPLSSPSVSVSSCQSKHTLQVRFDSKDMVVEAAYQGKQDPWLASLCILLKDLPLKEAVALDHHSWEEKFRDDQTYWEMRQGLDEKVFFPALDLLAFAIESYRGREFIFEERSPLICRCFGVREDDVRDFIKGAEEVTLEKLSTGLKAGMGCRSCVPQIKRWLAIHSPEVRRHYFKDRSFAEWLLMFDDLLDSFPDREKLGLTLEGIKGNQVLIGHASELTQKEEELIGGKLQGFLAGASDADFAFFLRRSRQRSKADG